MDKSGDDQLDEEYMTMFREAAGRPSWVTKPQGLRQVPEGGMVEKDMAGDPSGAEGARPRGVRLFPNAPLNQSVVDTIVFGRDMDLSGNSRFGREYGTIHEGAAGSPSWVENPKGLGCTFRRRARHQSMLQKKAEKLLSRLRGSPRDVTAAYQRV